MDLPGGGTSINLTNVFENMKPGSMKLYLSTPDIEAAYKELKAKGVKPTAEITHAGWGTQSVNVRHCLSPFSLAGW
jgi:uncharacterized glyoxalase superfamily protein PhnB